MTRRIERVNELIRDEIAGLLQREIQDPRLGMLVSITDVSTSPDLRTATVLVSVMGSDEEGRLAMAALRHASGFIRHELSVRLKLRYVPSLTFKLDRSIAQGARVLELIHEIQEGER